MEKLDQDVRTWRVFTLIVYSILLVKPLQWAGQVQESE